MASPPLIVRAERFADRTALIELSQKNHSYESLLAQSAKVARSLLGTRADLNGARVAFLTEPGADYVHIQWGIWRAGGIALPLATMHPPDEIAHVIADAEPESIIIQPDLAERVVSVARDRNIPVRSPNDLEAEDSSALPDISADRPAMIVYTSGSTGKPKGVVTTHANIEAQITSLVAAWEWSADDAILLTLPLHHVHGIINVLGCCLWSGATCHIHSRFDAASVWQAFLERDLTIYMAVPTIYRRLVDYFTALSPDHRQRLTDACQKFRLMVSGSAALPVNVLDEWKRITGHTLLERYGMTEIGMALANPLRGARRPGFVGVPLPNVRVKLVDENGASVPAGSQGEILVRGPMVFREYWRRPRETRDAFENGWFKTGDMAIVENGYYRIIGRRSVDIIKTGGYKVSALEIEEVLRNHPAVCECAVIGLADREWGERVAVAMEARTHVDVNALRIWAKDRLAPYKIPTRAVVVDALPRNAMGKVVKARVADLFRDAR